MTLKPGDAYNNGLVQDCSNSIANALELLQFCSKSSNYAAVVWVISVQCQAITWTSADLYVGSWGANFNVIQTEKHMLSSKKMLLKMSFAIWYHSNF